MSLAIMLAPASEAAVVPTLTLVSDPPGVPFLSPEAGLGDPWVSYRLSLQATAGEHIGAVDVRIHGQLHQRWSDVDIDGVVNPSPVGSSADGMGDSHLIAPGNALFGLAASENNSGVGSPLQSVPGSVSYGLGSITRGAWANPGTTISDVAYLVVPREASGLKYVIDVASDSGMTLADISSECPNSICTTPNVDVVGNGMDIANGDTTPSMLDGTDFGIVPLRSQQRRMFTIFNGGVGHAAELNIRSPVITGPFSVSGLTGPNQFIFRNFFVTLDTSRPGTYFGSVSFSTDDPTAPVFSLSLAARVVPEPASHSFVGLLVVALPIVRQRRLLS